MSKENSRAKRVSSPKFRTFLGKEIRKRRIDLDYSLADMQTLTGIPSKTVVSIEKGEALNIDYYVECAKAVRYDFGPLSESGVEVKPQANLNQEQTKRIKLTKEIRSLVTDHNFLEDGKDVEQIITELIRLKAIDKDQVTSVEVAGVMRNLVTDETVEVLKKQGNKNIYIIKYTSEE